MKDQLTIKAAIPVYNERRAIVRCIRSVLAQTTDWTTEIIGVDEGSTDGTDSVLAESSNKFSIASVLHLHTQSRISNPFRAFRVPLESVAAIPPPVYAALRHKTGCAVAACDGKTAFAMMAGGDKCACGAQRWRV